MGGRRGGNNKLVPPVGPLLWTLVRLCVDSTDSRRDIDMQVLFNRMCKYNANNEGFC